MLHDLRYALRALRRNPGFTLAATLSIGLAIGANAAIFGLADALFLRPLDVPDPHGVVTLATRPADADGRLSYPEYVEFRDATRSFDALAAVRPVRAGLARDAQSAPELRIGFGATAGFLETLRLNPRLGRGFTAEEDRVPGRNPVVMLGEGLWRADFAADPAVLGRQVRLNGIDFEVIGVVPDALDGMFDLARPTFYVPVMMLPALEGGDPALLTDRSRRILTVKGRLRPEVTKDTAGAEAAAIFGGFATTYPATNRSVTATVFTEIESRFDGNPNAPRLLALLGTLTIVLLAIACGNVANLVLGRASTRTREVGVRLAIGAGRMRLLRQMMTESLVLALAGGTVGVLVAAGALALLETFAPQSNLDVPTPLAVRLDARNILVTLALSAGSGVLLGLAPALRAGRTDLLAALKSGVTGRARERMFGRSTLVVVQIAGSLVLLVAATQMARGFSYALEHHPGFATEGRLVMRLDPSLVGYSPAQTEQFYRQLTDRAAGVPGVRSVALASSLPTVPGFTEVDVVPEGFVLPQGQDSLSIVAASVDENYFATVGVGMVRGRDFAEADSAAAPWVVVVDETFASRYLGENPIGARIRFVGAARTAEVVGVSVASRHNSIFMEPRPFMYLPATQHPSPRMTLVAETAGDPAALIGPLRDVVRSIDINVPVYRVETIEELFQRQSRAVATLIVGIATVVGFVGLTLALIGLYAVVAYHVNLRTREIGIRMAVGAVRGQVMAMILRQAAVVAAIGIGIGTAVSFAGGRGLAAMLNVPDFDPWLFGAVPVALLATTLLAAALPARRAATLDPQRALRQD